MTLPLQDLFTLKAAAMRPLIVCLCGSTRFMQAFQEANLRETVAGKGYSADHVLRGVLQHMAYHAGQIVLLAKHFTSDQWQSLTVPRNKSLDFERQVRAGEASQR